MKCEVCGKEIEKSQYMGCVICSGECFQKHFWMEIIKEKDEHIVINGECFCDGGNVDNPSYPRFLGHSGRRFWICFKDGSTLTTNNLWYNGKIPDEFREQLPDTADFYWPNSNADTANNIF